MAIITAEKAFEVVEAIWALDNALWDLFYVEFLTLCEEKSVDFESEKGDNRVES